MSSQERFARGAPFTYSETASSCVAPEIGEPEIWRFCAKDGLRPDDQPSSWHSAAMQDLLLVKGLGVMGGTLQSHLDEDSDAVSSLVAMYAAQASRMGARYSPQRHGYEVLSPPSERALFHLRHVVNKHTAEVRTVVTNTPAFVVPGADGRVHLEHERVYSLLHSVAVPEEQRELHIGLAPTMDDRLRGPRNTPPVSAQDKACQFNLSTPDLPPHLAPFSAFSQSGQMNFDTSNSGETLKGKGKGNAHEREEAPAARHMALEYLRYNTGMQAVPRTSHCHGSLPQCSSD